VTLFEYAAQQGYVARDTAADIANIAGPRVVAGPTGVFTPEQIRQILTTLDGTDRVICALGAFCGLRSAELHRLRWENMRLDQKVLIVDAQQTKTASRRVVPLPPNAVAWIAPLIPAHAAGRISRHEHPDYQGEVFSEVAQSIGIKWVRNGLRHSWCSYRLALTKNAAQTAHEAGNSPGILHRNYTELVTEAEATEWFEIRPD
jgi:integrase